MRFVISLLILSVTPVMVFGQARYRSANFVVSCDSEKDAKNCADWAEKYRMDWSKEWLGKEMPTWEQPCPVRISFTPGGGGVTSFEFFGSRISQRMQMNGNGQDVCCNVLPHEVTHTIFAAYFKRPNVPRWADEGAATLSESLHSWEQRRSKFLKGGHSWTLRQLFAMRDYPSEAHVSLFYAQSHCITRFLVQRHGRKAFLNLVSVGMESGWDKAVRTVGYRSVEDLEGKWKETLTGAVSGSAPSGSRGDAVPAVRISAPSGAAPISNGWDESPRSGQPAVREIEQPRQQPGRLLAQPYAAPPSVYVPRGGQPCPT